MDHSPFELVERTVSQPWADDMPTKVEYRSFSPCACKAGVQNWPTNQAFQAACIDVIDDFLHFADPFVQAGIVVLLFLTVAYFGGVL